MASVVAVETSMVVEKDECSQSRAPSWVETNEAMHE